MKKIIRKMFLLMLVIIGGLFAVGCNNEDLTGLEYVKDKGTFIVGFTDFPPFGYVEDGKYLGFDLEVAKLVCEKLDVTFEAQYINWDAQVFEIYSKKVDCIWNGMTITEARCENMIFSKPYFQTELVVLTTVSSNLTTIQGVNDIKIGVEANGTADLNLSENDDYSDKLEKFTTVSDALLALEGGQIDVIVVDKTYANDYVMQKEAALEKYKILDGTVGDIEEYGIAFRKEDSDLRDAVDTAFDELVAEGKVAPILAKYFGESNGFTR